MAGNGRTVILAADPKVEAPGAYTTNTLVAPGAVLRMGSDRPFFLLMQAGSTNATIRPVDASLGVRSGPFYDTATNMWRVYPKNDRPYMVQNQGTGDVRVSVGRLASATNGVVLQGSTTGVGGAWDVMPRSAVVSVWIPDGGKIHYVED